jgi:hypothetical protein
MVPLGQPAEAAEEDTMFRKLASGVAAVIAVACLSTQAQALTVKPNYTYYGVFHPTVITITDPNFDYLAYFITQTKPVDPNYSYGALYLATGLFRPMKMVRGTIKIGVESDQIVITQPIQVVDGSSIVPTTPGHWACVGLCPLWANVMDPRHFTYSKIVGTMQGGTYSFQSPVPVPPTFPLFLSAIVGLLGFRWCRRAA